MHIGTPPLSQFYSAGKNGAIPARKIWSSSIFFPVTLPDLVLRHHFEAPQSLQPLYPGGFANFFCFFIRIFMESLPFLQKEHRIPVSEGHGYVSVPPDTFYRIWPSPATGRSHFSIVDHRKVCNGDSRLLTVIREQSISFLQSDHFRFCFNGSGEPIEKPSLLLFLSFSPIVRVLIHGHR